MAPLGTEFASRGRVTSPALLFGDHESPRFLRREQRRGLTIHVTHPGPGPRVLRDCRRWRAGPPSHGHPPLATLGRESGESPPDEGAEHHVPSPLRAWWEEDGDEDNGDKDVPRSPRDAEHTGREAIATKSAQGCHQLGDRLCCPSPPQCRPRGAKKPLATEIRSLCTRVQCRGP